MAAEVAGLRLVDTAAAMAAMEEMAVAALLDLCNNCYLHTPGLFGDTSTHSIDYLDRTTSQTNYTHHFR
jgi:hypothetical protein